MAICPRKDIVPIRVESLQDRCFVHLTCHTRFTDDPTQRFKRNVNIFLYRFSKIPGRTRYFSTGSHVKNCVRLKLKRLPDRDKLLQWLIALNAEIEDLVAGVWTRFFVETLLYQSFKCLSIADPPAHDRRGAKHGDAIGIGCRLSRIVLVAHPPAIYADCSI